MDDSTVTSKRLSPSLRPKTAAMRPFCDEGGRVEESVPLTVMEKPTEGLTRAMRWNSCMMLESSVWLLLRNFLRAGILKKRLRTSKLAPTGQEHGSWETKREPSISRRVPSSLSAWRVCSDT